VSDTDVTVERILRSYAEITVVGASRHQEKAAHYVPAHMQRHGWRIVPVNPYADTILGEPVHRRPADVPGMVGLVDVFRPSGQTPDIARQALPPGPPRCGCSWASPRLRRGPSPSRPACSTWRTAA